MLDEFGMQKRYLTEVVLLIKSNNLKDFTDWIKWHLDTIGFEHCHVFDNESSVDLKRVCSVYGTRISYERVVGFPNQYALYNDYVNNRSPAWWVLPIDDDEYLWMRDFTNVNRMILYYQNKWPQMDKLSIRWKNMFPEDPKSDRDGMSLMDFCKISNESWASLFDGGNKPVKTFVRTTKPLRYDITAKQTHNPINGSKSYMCNGERLEGNWYFGDGGDDALKLLHYQFKSKKEWEWKCLHRRRVSMVDTVGYNKHRLNIVEKMV